MNNPLTDLGESLSGAFREQMARWSALEYSFLADSLNASLELAEDIVCLEEAWQSLVSLDQVFEAGFVPDDLFVASDGSPITLEQAHLAPRSIRLGNYPFTATPRHAGTGDLPADIPTKSEGWPMNDWASSQLASGSVDEPSPKHQAFSFAVSEYPSSGFPEDQVQSGVEISSPDFTVITDGRLSMSDAVWNSMVLNSDNSTTPIPAPTAATDADSFWRQPLQNLGDFATRIMYTVTEQSENAKTASPAWTTAPGTGQLTANLAWKTENEPTYGTTAELPAAQEQPASRDSVFKIPPIPGRSNSLSSTASNADFQPENQALQSVVPQRILLPDTDDLLEALTERIFRDFRRYYP